MIRAVLAFLLFLYPLYLSAASYPVQLGDETVTVQYSKHGEGKSFVHVHQNETTALAAARSIIKSEGGTLITLVHSGKRNIVFHLDSRRYEFDPNRIFSDSGIRKTLSNFGNYSPGAHHEVNKLANKIKLLLPKGKIIAVHNNQSYSLKDYLPGHSLALEAESLAFHDPHYRNFFLVTKQKDYVRLKNLSFNSILQIHTPSDDGSLSVYLATREYINVEAGYDQLGAQIVMLQNA